MVMAQGDTSRNLSHLRILLSTNCFTCCAWKPLKANGSGSQMQTMKYYYNESEKLD